MRLYIKAILILASLVTVSRACDIGCIRCNQETQECLACDFRNDYVPTGNGGCEVSTITDCVKLNYNGDCIFCAPGTYYDQDTNNCVAVTDPVDNCRTYSGPSSCSLCNNKHYLGEGTCVMVDAGFHIRHCTAYNSEEKCTECRKGFVPNAAGDTCVKVDVNVCHNYNNYFCNKCDAASIANSNAYLLKPFDDGNETAIKNVLNRLVDSNINTFVSSICMPTSVDHCKIFRAHNKCFMCEDGHFLTANEQCQAYTVNDLNGCQDFVSETECLKCSNGHYLEAGTCVISTIVENCELYSESEDSCAQCTEAYYLFEGACVARVNYEVTFCASYTVDADTCESCEATHQIDDAGTVCVELPTNCKEFAGDANNEVCGVCASGYYVDGNGDCVAGSVVNCDVYTVDADTCESCLEGYSLGENECVEHDTSVENCETYLKNLPTRCETCDSGSVKFLQKSVCELNDEIPFCTSFSDINTCETCALGYQLVDNGCVQIPEGENCLEKDAEGCVRCLDDYEIIDDACVLIPPYYSENCAIVNPETVGTTFECLGCATDYIPITDVQNICVEAAEQSFTLIDNCEKYIENTGVYECKLCSIGFALSSDRTACVESCLETEVMYLGVLNKLVTNIADVTAFAQCVDIDSLTDIPTGCEVASHNIKGENNVCLKCAAGYIPIETCTLDNTFFNIDNFEAMEEGQAFPVVSCALKDDNTVFFPTSVDPDINCQNYLPIGDNYYCNQCVFGVTGTVLIDNGNQYLDCTGAVEGCNTDVGVGSGFNDDTWIADMYGFNLAYKYTCHKCTDANQIPFIHLNDNNGLEGYQLNSNDDIPSEALELDGKMTVCREPTAEGLTIDSETFTGFVDNCALGLIVVDLAKSDDIANDPSVRCLACKDGFKRTFDASGFYIESCDPIDNCAPSDNGEWFDGCKTCATGFAKALNVNGEVDANNCTASTNIANCRVYDVENDNCAYCERGYYKDHDGQCVNIGIPHCSGFAQKAELSFKLTGNVNNYSYVYYFGASGFDCYSCDVGYVALGVELSKPICVSHPNLETQSAEAESNYITNCERYYLDVNDDLLCRQCGAGFVINADYTTCFEETGSLENCKVCDLTGTTCEDCLEGYLLDAGQCFEANITNCASYEINDTGNGTICASCELGYVLENGSCSLGSIDNCGVYIDDDTCESCQKGYFLLLNECFAIPTHTNCLEVTMKHGEDQVYHCDVCESGYTLNDNIDPNDYPICVKAPMIEGCVSYNADFECHTCGEDYYLDAGDCTLRENTVTNCLLYKSNADECERCISDYVITENQECAEVLNNIDFCVRYTSEDVCDLCATGRYLFENECPIVPEANLIDNCEFYSSDTDCSHCLDGFVLINNECQEQVATDCESFRSPNVCQSCPEGYHLQRRTQDGDLIVDCVQGQVDNCIDYNLFSGACRACQPHYVLGAEGCNAVAVAEQIDNCKIYKTETECEVCDMGYIRSSSGSSCTLIEEIEQFEPNCIDLRYSDEPRCTACRPGTYFNSGKCVQCSANTIADGCKFCNPIDNSECLVCRAGYYMNESGACVSDDSAVNGDDDP